MSKKLIAGAGVVASFAIALAPLATFAESVNGTVSDQHTDKLVLTVLPSCTFGSAHKSTDSYPGGITHDDSAQDKDASGASASGVYGANGTSAGEEETRGATAWTTTETTTGTAGATDSVDSGNHNSDVLQSTGYGTLNGEGGVNATNGLTNHSKHTVHRSMLAGTSTSNFAQTKMMIVCNNGTGYSVTATATALGNGDSTPLTIPVVAAGGYDATTSGYNGIVAAGTGVTKDADVVQTGETVIAHKASVTAEAGDSITVTYGMGVASSQKADTYVGTVTYKLYKGVNGDTVNTDDTLVIPAQP